MHSIAVYLVFLAESQCHLQEVLQFLWACQTLANSSFLGMSA